MDDLLRITPSLASTDLARLFDEVRDLISIGVRRANLEPA
jgi:hypothetical protein